MKIGILGSGGVATTLAAGFLKHDHEVMLGSRTPAKLNEFIRTNPRGRSGEVAEAAGFGNVLVLAVRGSAALDVLAAAGAANLAGKTVIDTTNPLDGAPPVNGVLSYFTTPGQSLMEQLQAKYPEARFVKAFSSVGAAAMVNPAFRAGTPSMFIAGNDAAAKQTVTRILDQFGWETEDMGGAEAARAIEPLCILWCIPGFLRGDWYHAFKVLR